jgi:hypothetical protein
MGKVINTDLELTKMVLCKNPSIRQLSWTENIHLGLKNLQNRVLE